MMMDGRNGSVVSRTDRRAVEWRRRRRRVERNQSRSDDANETWESQELRSGLDQAHDRSRD